MFPFFFCVAYGCFGSTEVFKTLIYLCYFFKCVICKASKSDVRERFLALKDFEKKKRKVIAKAICEFLGDEINSLMNCQALFALCSSHTLNSCGIHAVE